MKYSFDAILVLGTSTDKKLFKDRVEKAVEMYKKGVSNNIIFSGRWWGGLKDKPDFSEAVEMSKYARSLGLSRKNMLLEQRSLNTIGNFYFTKKYILEPNLFKNVLIITHTSHLDKVIYLAKKILGPGYKMKFIADTERIDSSVVIHKNIGDIKKFFVGIKKGEDEKILRLLKNILIIPDTENFNLFIWGYFFSLYLVQLFHYS